MHLEGTMMRVLLADGHPLLLAGLREILEADGGFEIVAEASHGSEVMPLIAHAAPETVLLAMHMPGIDSIACLDRIRAAHPSVHVVMLTNDADPLQIQSAFRHGACGVLMKTIGPRDLAAAIRQAVDGTAFHASGLPAITDTAAAAQTVGLTTRELEIVRAVASGYSNRAIARELWITEPTVKFHLTNAFRKLGVSNRTEAARWALERGLQLEATKTSES
jgi:DNA-binding NarL/FixJ family response regulator